MLVSTFSMFIIAAPRMFVKGAVFFARHRRCGEKIKMELCWLRKDGLVSAVVYKNSKNTVQMDRFLKFASHPTMYILKIAKNHAKRPKERLQSQKIPV